MVTPGVLFVALAALVASPGQSQDRCRSDLLPVVSAEPARTRIVSPLDLARLRDFGKQDVGFGGEAPFSISPDGTLVALVLRRGDPGRDDYCIGVVVLPLSETDKARLLDVGGEFMLHLSDVRGIPDLPVGNAEPVTPRWSPDGRSLAYLRRDGGRTRVWVANVDGSGARPVSHLEVDARDVHWSADGRSLLVKSRPGLVAAETAMAAEAREGFLYDRRFWTLSKSRPAPPPSDFVEQAIDIGDGAAVKPGTSRIKEESKPDGAIEVARSASGDLAWTFARVPQLLVPPIGLKVSFRGRTVVCRSSYCDKGVAALWWGQGDELFFMQAATPENGGITKLLRWRVGHESGPAIVLSTADALFGCQPAAGAVICAREAATRPRHLVRVDLRTGKGTPIYDPNPEFANLQMGSVRRLRWVTAEGARSFGDLVLPPDHEAGAQHPLIVVQYSSRGFLRGGTGDEYPIQALAGRGFAVLSVERTEPLGLHTARTNVELVRTGTRNFAERRRVFASLQAGVRRAIALGVIDRQRIGITGLSDGAATVQYALVNSTMFRAAAISSCCDEPAASMFAAGPGYADFLINAGFPAPGTDGSAFWRHYSLAANAARIRTPILLQVTDDEFRLALQTFVTLQHQHVPIEMYVFPDEFHQKWRPAHRLATYQRAIDWFDFWLNGRVDTAPAKAAQFTRWRALARTQRR